MISLSGERVGGLVLRLAFFLVFFSLDRTGRVPRIPFDQAVKGSHESFLSALGNDYLFIYTIWLYFEYSSSVK